MRTRQIAAALVAAGLLAACGTANADTPTAGTVEGTAAPTDTAVDVPADDADADYDGPLEAYPSFGFVHAVDASGFPATVTFDEAVWFDGADADAAAREDGHEIPEGGLPNGYYIRNATPGLSTYPMAGNVVISIVDPERQQVVLTPQEWQERIAAQATGEGALYEPYHFVFDGDTIVEIVSQYVP